MSKKAKKVKDWEDLTETEQTLFEIYMAINEINKTLKSIAKKMK